MKENIIVQFRQFYGIFTAIVNDYDDEAWFNMGHNRTTAYVLAFHILDATKFYMQDESGYELENGETLPSLGPDDITPRISRADIIKNILIQKDAIIDWVKNMNLDEKQKNFEWTGPDMGSVALFISRHSHFHLGELNALLNEYKKGEAKDNYVPSNY
jgi:hypothetical protein